MADKLEEWIKEPSHFWLGDFAVLNRMSRKMLTRVATRSKTHPHYSVKLSVVWKIAKTLQESKLVKMGFSKQSNPAFAIFVLKNVAGWKEKKTIEHEGTLIHLLAEIRKRNQPLVKENYAITEPGKLNAGRTAGEFTGQTMEIKQSVLDQR